jgi:Zn-dependent protease with chaperone function
VLAVATWFNALGLVGGAVMATAGLAVLPRLERPPPGHRLRPEEVPALHDLTDEIAEVLSVPPVQVIVLGADFNIGYAATGLTQRRVLVIGLPFWSVLTGQERIAVLGHEFGHAVSGDPSTSIVIGGALQTLGRWEAMLRPDRTQYTQAWARAFLTIVDPVLYLLSLLPRAAHTLLGHLVLRDQQRCEYVSDVDAVHVAGTDATLGALEKTLLGPVVDDELARLGATVATRDVWPVVRQRAERVMAVDRDRLLRAAAAERASLDATHPPTTLRLELIDSLEHQGALVHRTAAEWAGIDAELEPLAGPVGRALVTRYRD